MLDTKIVNARVIDGSGRAAVPADVGILGGKIAAIGDLKETAAGETIDARGRALTPGFLDIHRHADLAILSPDFGDLELRQGLTTIVNGNCGLSAAPLAGPHRQEVRRYLAPITGDAGGAALPHGGGVLPAVRRPAPPRRGAHRHGDPAGERRGLPPRPPRRRRRPPPSSPPWSEPSRTGGRWGCPWAFGHAPESYETTEELISLLSPLRRSGVVISVHMRQEGDGRGGGPCRDARGWPGRWRPRWRSAT